MKNRIFFKSALMFLCLTLMSYTGFARGLGGKGDVFKGKLFPPNIIMENREALGLTKKQFTAIRAIVVEVRTNVAEHEWDMQDAYRRVLSKLDETPRRRGPGAGKRSRGTQGRESGQANANHNAD